MSVDPDLIGFLMNPASYPERPSRIEHFETHISHVFVGDRFVYKIKKPVDFGFLNFTTLSRRRSFCIQEVLVNSVLAADVYLGVRPIYIKNGGYAFASERGSRVIEYAVRMKRIPTELVLSNLITQGKLLYRRLEPVGKRLSRFHRGAPIYRGSAFGGLNAVVTNTEENFEQIKASIGTILDDVLYERLCDYTRGFIKQNGHLFDRRKKDGCVKDGHGDLHAQHICLTRPPIILDRIEFSKRFRISDILEDIAFLFMDLEYRGRFDLSANLLSSYFRGVRRRYDEELVRFYKIYRAVVRAKIEGFAFANLTDEAAKASAGRRAREYYALAQYYLDHCKDRFNPIIFMGVSGSGKSAIADGLLSDTMHLRSDEIRKELTGTDLGEHLYVGYESAIYDRQTTDRVYQKLRRKTVDMALSGKRVVLDATYGLSEHRRDLFTACMKGRLNPFFIYCFAPPDVLRKRISRRMANGRDVSDARVEILEEQMKHAEEPNELPSFRLMRLNTHEPLSSIRKSLRLFL
jgi:aminoglycoside phosphotransferase family enzyme/predicted kinase